MTLPAPNPTPGCPRCNKFHRRAQLAEAALLAVDPERLERAGRSGGCLGRTFLRWYSGHMQHQRDQALSVADELSRALEGHGDGRAALIRWRHFREALR